MILAWGSKVSAAFRERVLQVAQDLGCDPSWLMACMAFETGQTFSSWVKNAVSGATGLIQFMPSTARSLGTTTDALATLSAEDQLLYVHRYFKPYAGKINSLSDCYMAILWPAAIGFPDDHVIFGEGSKAYLQNRGLDLDKDGNVTKGECAAFVEKQLRDGLAAGNAFEYPIAVEPAPIEDISVPPVEKKQMDPLTLIAMFGPAIAKLIPQIADFLKKEPEKKLSTVKKVLDVIVDSSGQANVQGAVEAMQNDPALREKVTQAVITHPDIIGLVELGGGVAAAREFALRVQDAEKPFWFNPVFWISVALMPMMYMIVAQILFTTAAPVTAGMNVTDAPFWARVGFDQETRSGLTNLIVGFIFGGIVGVWFGTSWGSQRKTELASKVLPGGKDGAAL